MSTKVETKISTYLTFRIGKEDFARNTQEMVWEDIRLIQFNQGKQLENPVGEVQEEKKTVLKTKIIDGKYMLYIKKGKHGNQMFFEHYEVPGLNTESMTEFEEMTGMTQDELVAFAKDFEIWD